MRFKFWGVRGSIATPGPSTVRYGGNTTCIEIRGASDELVILDAGTGIFQLGNTLAPEFPININIFLSHTHWDHIQGLPMFSPIFVPGNKITIHGAMDIVSQHSVKEVLSRQMEHAYFPVKETELAAELSYVDLQENDCIEFGETRVTNCLLNHPVLNFGYRVESGDKSLVFTGDHEWPFNIYDQTDPEYVAYQEIIDARRQKIIDFFKEVDALIIDTSYDDIEYEQSKVGWGHGTFDKSIAAAKESSVKKCYLTHHEPTRSDDELEDLYFAALERNEVSDSDPEFILAKEGVEYLA